VPAAAVAVETGTLYVGAATGTAVLLRDATAGACARYIFNVRASYAQEARATLELFQAKGITSYENLISFDQDDSYGQSGYDGLLAGYRDLYGSDPAGSIARFRYTRNDDTSVPAQAVAMEAYLAQRLQAQSGTVTVGIFMTDTYGAATTLIQHVRNWQYANDSQQTSLEKATRLKLYFSNMSFANADAMAERLVALGNVQTPSGLVPYTDGVLVSQVVPNFDEDTSDAIVAYKQRVSTPSYMSLEGYISARVLIAALLAHEGPFTSDGLRETLETAQLDIGLAGTFGFASDRQFSDTVWGTALQPNGKYRTLYSWRQGQAIDIAY
jgi:ABC-type branched-subunit amino acid transport system substrate-binding protein